MCAPISSLPTSPRKDHAQYAATWVRALRHDPQALFTAASRAQTAADWLHDRHVERFMPEGSLNEETQALIGVPPTRRSRAASGAFKLWGNKMIDPPLMDLPALQDALDKLGLVITLKEPTEAMLKRGWHCIDFDRPEYVTSMTEWNQAPPPQNFDERGRARCFRADERGGAERDPPPATASLSENSIGQAD